MFSLIVVTLGTLLSLAGLIAVAPQVKTHHIDGSSLAAWLFRSGILVLLAGEAVAIVARPDPLVLKVMLIAGAAILFVGLTMLPHEWQQPGFALTKSLSWQVTLLGLAAFWMAVMYIEALLMLAGALASLLVARHARRQAAAGSVDFKTMHFATLIVRGTVIFLAIVLLFL